MAALTILKYLEQDDENMYFEVFNSEEGEYVSKGIVFIGKVKSLRDFALSTKERTGVIE